MKIQDRWFQKEASEALMKDVESNSECHPIVVAPTGTGKTHIISRFVDLFLNKYPEYDILVLCDESNVLEQDYNTLCDYFSDAIVGLYSAGLESREISKITVAGIQSVYKLSDKFKNCKIVIIDEAHTVKTKETGMYRNFLKEIKANYVGLTATPFRTGHGYIHEGKGTLFNKISYDMSKPEMFKRLQDEGWLSKIYPASTDYVMDPEKDNIRKLNGDYRQDDLSNAYDREEVTRDCCDEAISFANKTKRKKWLIFAIDINHAEHIKNYLVSKGIKAESVHSKKKNRKQIIKAYKNDEYEAIVNVDMLVKGFDEQRIDFIVILRPTMSPVIHVQLIGRGTRVYYVYGFDLTTTEGRLAAIEAGPKQECFVMDFPANTDKLGPIDDVVVKKKGDKKKSGPMVKNCPQCKIKNHLSARFCIYCGYKFEFKTKLNAIASTKELTSIPINDRDDLIYKKWVDVDEVKYVPIYYKGNIKSIKVIYGTEDLDLCETIKPEEKKYQGRIAEYWIKKRWDFDNNVAFPKTAKDLWTLRDFLLKPNSIYVDVCKKYKKILDYKFEKKINVQPLNKIPSTSEMAKSL